MGTVTDEGEVSDEFEEIHAGRRLVLEYPISPGTKIQAVVLDSADTLGVEFVMKCAAMLVPSGHEADWMYSSEGGQWQLLASAGVTRLILISRTCDAVQQADNNKKKGKGTHRHDSHRQGKRMELLHGKQRGRRSTKLEEQPQADMLIGHTDDEVLKHIVGPLVLALAPKVSFDTGFPSIPFVSYTDNVLQRVVVEEAWSTLTGLMRVEDVELESENSPLEPGTNSIQQTNGGGPRKEEISCELKPKQPTRSWRRRLIFRRMPNLIQTEVLLTLKQPPDSKRRVSDKGRKSDDEGESSLKHKAKLRQGQQPDPINVERAVRRVDHSRLVHKYLPPIIAGFVLVAPRLDTCFMSELGRARVLSIGVGGGALPIFLRKHFRFHIQVYEYLVETPAGTQTRESIQEFVAGVQAFNLTDAEKLQSINLRPSTAVEVHLIVEDCDERLSTSQVERFIGTVTESLPEPPLKPEAEAEGEVEGEETEEANPNGEEETEEVPEE